MNEGEYYMLNQIIKKTIPIILISTSLFAGYSIDQYTGQYFGNSDDRGNCSATVNLKGNDMKITLTFEKGIGVYSKKKSFKFDVKVNEFLSGVNSNTRYPRIKVNVGGLIFDNIRTLEANESGSQLDSIFVVQTKGHGYWSPWDGARCEFTEHSKITSDQDQEVINEPTDSTPTNVFLE